jgi:hypothetical protein
VLLSGEGFTGIAMAAAVSNSVLTVRSWRRATWSTGWNGLSKDATRPPALWTAAAIGFGLGSLGAVGQRVDAHKYRCRADRDRMCVVSAR